MNPAQLPKHIFGIHDKDGAQLLDEGGRKGWVVLSVKATDTPENFSALSGAGHGVIVRLNHGYESEGTIPAPARYDEFGAACARYVESSSGAHIWIIGNETNLEGERPGNQGGKGGDPITPQLYGECFAKCRAAIRNVSGHGEDWVIPSPPGPWNPTTTYSANPNGDWVIYFRDILNECVKRGAPPDALALHTYSNHEVRMDAALVGSEERMGAPFQERHWQFRAYRDFLGIVPGGLRKLPVFITESQHLPWEDEDVGWIQAACAEINAWNADAANQPIQAFCLFRWQRAEHPPESGWGISDKRRLMQDFRAAMQNEFGVRWLTTAPPPGPKPPVVTPPPVVTTPPKGVLTLAKARWFVEEAIRKLEALDGNAAHEILLKTVIPWFYKTAVKHSTTLGAAQAQTDARWHCEEATRRIEDNKLGEARDLLLNPVLAWLTSSGPSSIGVLGIEESAEPKAPKKRAPRKKTTAKKRTAKKAAAKTAAAKKATAKKGTARKMAAKTAAAKKPKTMLLGVEQPEKGNSE